MSFRNTGLSYAARTAAPASGPLQRGWLVVLGLAAALLTACSAGSSPGSSAASVGSLTSNSTATQACSTCGTAMMSLTSTSSNDFLSYVVTIVSLSLTNSNGAVVQTIPINSQVDLTALTNLSQILTADQIPEGDYASASLTLDYSHATIVVNNGTTSGVTIPASGIIDGQSNQPLAAPNATQMTVTLSLKGADDLLVTRGTIANLALAFDLDASNTVSPSLTNPTSVTVNPVLTASLAPDVTRQSQLAGTFVSADTSAGTYLVNVRPFDDSEDDAGQLTVATTSTTAYRINGTDYTGSAGLAALAALPVGTLTQTDGTWDRATQTFTASEVLAGSSVAGTSQASVEATVTARSGDTLTLSRAHVADPDHGDLSFSPQITATVGPGTQVSEQDQSGALMISDISVGQRLELSGSLSTSAGSVSLDATNGSVELLMTPLLGTFGSLTGNQVTVSLQRLGGLPASDFNFTGTGSGTTGAPDATASAYTVAVPASVSTSGLSPGQITGFEGFVTAFGAAPPDFTALTMTSYAQSPAHLLVYWSGGTIAPFTTETGSELQISQAAPAPSVETVRVADVSLDLASASAGVIIEPNTAATAQTFQAFAIAHRNGSGVDTYSSFNDLVTALATDLNGTTKALQVSAYGPYNASTGVLTANVLVVVLDD